MRNRYLDLLRAAAIVRVIVYHLFGWPWLSIVLPAMGIMFALAGSLTAASLDKRAARQVVTSRLRRLLPPLWLLGLIAVPIMLAFGWTHEVDGEHPFSIPRLAFWLLPLGDPPGSDKGVDVWEPLWYIRAYVWFILLSPLMYLAYRRIGWFAVAVPLALMAVLDKTGFSLPDTADAAMWDFATYGACWIAGFAHHDGRLARLRGWIVITAAVVLGVAAIYWLRGHQGEDAWDLNDVSESQALWSVAFVLLALRWQPSMRWLGRARPLDRAVTLLNARAVTIYLWHNIAIALVWPVLTVLTLDDLGRLEGPVDLVVALLLTGVAVLAVGWAEDLAAKRRPRLWPVSGPSLRPAPVATERSPMPALVGAPTDDPKGFGTSRPTIFGAAPTGPGGSGVSAALGGRTGAAAALTRLHTAKPPTPRSGGDEPARTAAGRHQSGEIASGTRDFGLPVAGRRADPLNGTAQPANGADATTGGPGTTGKPESTGDPGAPGKAEHQAGAGTANSLGTDGFTTNGFGRNGFGLTGSRANGSDNNGSNDNGSDNNGSDGNGSDGNGFGTNSSGTDTSGTNNAGVNSSGTNSPSDGDDEVLEGEIWDGEGTGTWAATGPVLGTPNEFGWTAAPDDTHHQAQQLGRGEEAEGDEPGGGDLAGGGARTGP